MKARKLGQGTAQFAQLARLAKVLNSTPDEILKFGEKLDSDVFLGIIEGILAVLDRHPETAITGVAKRITPEMIEAGERCLDHLFEVAIEPFSETGLMCSPIGWAEKVYLAMWRKRNRQA
jgi:hypothetical protein